MNPRRFVSQVSKDRYEGDSPRSGITNRIVRYRFRAESRMMKTIND